jgi:predicted AAA+ superfamily ATPase
MGFIRSMMDKVNWNARLIGIKGARGIGKTTLLFQYIQLNLANELEHTLYASLDSFWFTTNSLSDLIATFEKRGGKYLFLDEVHKYPNWAQELKNAYDEYPQLKIVFTGSSALEIRNARADLSRRAVVYEMQGFSFREYLCVETGRSFDSYSLQELLTNHMRIAQQITTHIKPLQYFDSYLKFGYYPFYREQPELYDHKLSEVIHMILEIELPQLRGIENAYIIKLKQLLVAIATSVPFIPNVSKLSEKIQINRTTLLAYLHYLDEIRLTNNLFRETKGISKLQKPLKIYLENTNLIYNLAPKNANEGNLRETFFRNQVGFVNSIQYTEKGDFLIDEMYTVEIGGKSKTHKQLKEISNSFVVADAIEIGYQNKIPLWLFGFLY